MRANRSSCAENCREVSSPTETEVRKCLVANMFDKALIEELKNRYVLHWNFRRYEVLPLEILTFGSRVQEIYLKFNGLRSLPQWLGSLSNLTCLVLDGNSLQEIPSTIGDCQLLEVLNLQDNKLFNLPDSIVQLKNLILLNISGNAIRTLPIGFERLKALATLMWTRNQLEILPQSVCRLKSLQELILDQNKLRCLPKKIVELPSLTFLSVRNNNLDRLPCLPFINHPFISFTKNPTLNYILYELGCDLSRNSFVATDLNDDDTWRINITGCLSCGNCEPPVRSGILLATKDDFTKIRLPPEFNMVQSYEGPTTAPTLLELALRQSYVSIVLPGKGHNDLELVRNIPSIDQLLSLGPTARCSNIKCSAPLFTESILWTLKVLVENGDRPNRYVTSVIFFCSKLCSTEFASNHPKESSLRVQWFELI